MNQHEILTEICDISDKLLTHTEWTSVEEIEGCIARLHTLASSLIEEKEDT